MTEYSFANCIRSPVGDAKSVGLNIGGNKIVYDVTKQKWMGASKKIVDGQVTVRVLVDRSLIEVWGNGGKIVHSDARQKNGSISEITAFADGGTATLIRLKAFELASIWHH